MVQAKESTQHLGAEIADGNQAVSVLNLWRIAV
jgi:hypothetical protein